MEDQYETYLNEEQMMLHNQLPEDQQQQEQQQREQQQQQQQQEQGQQQNDPQVQAEHDVEQGDDMMGDSVFANVGAGLMGHYRNMMMAYWQETINAIEHEDHDFKNHQLPLARIKKVMKTDEEVRMISAEAPILFAKGCDIFITELTMRAWIHAEENKRRTLQRSDIAAALQKSDMFDFLIDIVPRDDDRPKRHSTSERQNSMGFTSSGATAGQPQPPSSSSSSSIATQPSVAQRAAQATQSIPQSTQQPTQQSTQQQPPSASNSVPGPNSTQQVTNNPPQQGYDPTEYPGYADMPYENRY